MKETPPLTSGMSVERLRRLSDAGRSACIATLVGSFSAELAGGRISLRGERPEISGSRIDLRLCRLLPTIAAGVGTFAGLERWSA